MTTTKHLIVSWFCVCYDCAGSGYDHRKAQDLKPPLTLGHTLFHQIQIPAEDQCSNSDPLISLLCLLSRILVRIALIASLSRWGLGTRNKEPFASLPRARKAMGTRMPWSGGKEKQRRERAWDRVKMCTDGVKWRHTIRHIKIECFLKS